MNKMTRITLTGAAVAGCVAIAAAGLRAGAAEGDLSPAQLSISSSQTEIDAESLWGEDCAGCHGRDGRGQTRVGRRVGAKDHTEPENQNDYSDQRAFKSLKEGMYKNGDELMKPFGEGRSEDNGLTDEEIVALVAYVREFGPDDWQWNRELNEAALEADEEREELMEYIEEHGPEEWRKD